MLTLRFQDQLGQQEQLDQQVLQVRLVLLVQLDLLALLVLRDQQVLLDLRVLQVQLVQQGKQLFLTGRKLLLAVKLRYQVMTITAYLFLTQ